MHAKMPMQTTNPEFRFTGTYKPKSRFKSSPPIANYNSGTQDPQHRIWKDFETPMVLDFVIAKKLSPGHRTCLRKTRICRCWLAWAKVDNSTGPFVGQKELHGDVDWYVDHRQGLFAVVM
jgi:hypothetical protein